MMAEKPKSRPAERGHASQREETASLNQDHFVHRPVHQIVGVLADPQLDTRLVNELQLAGIAVGDISVLAGDEGRGILDSSGSRHGRWAHLVRTVQRLGYDGNSLAIYDEALAAGGAVVHVTVSPKRVPPTVLILQHFGVRTIGYFGQGTFEQFR